MFLSNALALQRPTIDPFQAFDSIPEESVAPHPRSPSKVTSWIDNMENPKLEKRTVSNTDAGVKALESKNRAGLIKHKHSAAFKTKVQDSPLHRACLNPTTTAMAIEALLVKTMLQRLVKSRSRRPSGCVIQ
jgi:hypothetical protein